jgi:hypothetical protein
MFSRILSTTATTAARSGVFRAVAGSSVAVSKASSAAAFSTQAQQAPAASSAYAAAVAAAAFATVSASTVALCEFGGEEHKEAATGIAFPAQVDGMPFVGAGVRVKYGFVKVYAVGTYADTKGVKDMDAFMALPEKTLRIVMNRGLSVDKYIAALNEALVPRMNGQVG